jgi:hypothetical protein
MQPHFCHGLAAKLRLKPPGRLTLVSSTFPVARISAVFFALDGEARLRARLAEAKSRGAELAVLPELAPDPWWPATKSKRR